MGTNKEPSAEQSASQIEEDIELSPEQNSPVDQDPKQPEDGKLLNTYKWHTGAKTEAPPQGAIERLEKGASNKWNKMQSWRKALSEDAGEKCSTAARGAESPSKPDKPATSRKNPFRRALSEPPGSLLSSVLSSSSASGSSSAQASGTTVQDTTQKGKIRKYLQTVSQKFKRPRLPSTLIAEHDKEKSENVAQEPVRLSWAPPQDVPVWDISNCFLQDGQILIPREEEPLMRVRNRASSYLSSLSLHNISGSNTEPHFSDQPTGLKDV